MYWWFSNSLKTFDTQMLSILGSTTYQTAYNGMGAVLSTIPFDKGQSILADHIFYPACA